MSKGKNKIIALLAGVLLVVVICGFGVLAKNTATLHVANIGNITYETNVNSETRMGKLTIDGAIAYCVEPDVHVPDTSAAGQEAKKRYVGTLNASFGTEKLTEIELISFYGYEYPGHQTNNYYLASQELIWELLGYSNVVYRTNKGGSVISVQAEKDVIKKLISENNIVPSFNGETHQMKKGASLSLTDTNNVLSGFTKIISSDPNVTVTKNVNTLNIAVKNNNSVHDRVTIKLIKPSSEGKIYKEYGNGEHQNTVSTGNSTDNVEGTREIISYVYLEIEGGIPTPPSCIDDPETRDTTCGSSTVLSKDLCPADEVDPNDYYTISCSENLKFNHDNKKSININAGEGFAYDMSIFGKRNCKGVFNVTKWTNDWNNVNATIMKEHNKYVDYWNQTKGGEECDSYQKPNGHEDCNCTYDKVTGEKTGCGSCPIYISWCRNSNVSESKHNVLLAEMRRAEKARDAAVRQKNNLTNIKNTFDTWNNNYNFEPDLTINIEEGDKSKNIDMVEHIISSENDHHNDKTLNKTWAYLNTCEFSGETNAVCNYNNQSLYTNWERESFVEADYTLPHKYIKKNSQATVTGTNCKECIDGGNKYYTSFDTPSGTYDIKVTAKNLGHKGKWTVIDKCDYELNNIMKPEKPDPNYGNTFLYRPISLFTPFPNRVAGPNWLNREHLITDNASNLYNETPEFVVNLSPSDIKAIKADNDTKKVGSQSEVYTEYVNNSKNFDPKKPYKSKFIWTTFRELFNIKGGN